MFSEDRQIAVVVCESDLAILEMMCNQLSADRFEVLPAPSPADALRLCRYNCPGPKL